MTPCEAPHLGIRDPSSGDVVRKVVGGSETRQESSLCFSYQFDALALHEQRFSLLLAP